MIPQLVKIMLTYYIWCVQYLADLKFSATAKGTKKNTLPNLIHLQYSDNILKSFSLEPLSQFQPNLVDRILQ